MHKWEISSVLVVFVEDGLVRKTFSRWGQCTLPLCACWNICSTSRCRGFSLWSPSCCFFWFLLPPEVAPPAPLQTQDGSAVAKKKQKQNTDTTVAVCFVSEGVSVGCGRCRKQTPPSHFFFPTKTKEQKQQQLLFMQRRSSSTKQTSRRVPVWHQPAPSGSRQGGTRFGLSPANSPLRGAAPGGGF